MDYVIYFVITIGILVFVHEFGHFAAAKLSKMRADIFAIGFGKRLVGWNKITGLTFGDLPKDFDGDGHTDYRLCLLPLGGYVKIAGMVDESFDTEFADAEPKPYEFRSKSTIKKLFVISAGVLMNLLLAIAVFWFMNFSRGEHVIKTTQIGVVQEKSIAYDAGFRSDDIITAVNGVHTQYWQDVVDNMLLENIGSDLKVDITRNGSDTTIVVPSKIITSSLDDKFFLNYAFTRPFISTVFEGSPAEKAGIKAGDLFLTLNNENVVYGEQVSSIVSSHKNVEMPLVILRDKDTVYTSVTPGDDGLIGISFSTAYIGPYDSRPYGFFGSFVKSVEDISTYTQMTLSMFKNVITGDVAFNQVFGGPIKIAQFAAKSADSGFFSFMYFLAMLSLSLAIINILPFPVLDGGHFVIILLEGVIRKELPIKIKIAIQNAGFIVLLLLMAFIIYSDIISL